MTHDWKAGTKTMLRGQVLTWTLDDGDIDLGFNDGTFITFLNREQALNLVAGICHLLNQMEKKK